MDLNLVLSTPRYCRCGFTRVLACNVCFRNSETYISPYEYQFDEAPEVLLDCVKDESKTVVDFTDRRWHKPAETGDLEAIRAKAAELLDAGADIEGLSAEEKEMHRTALIDNFT